MSKVVKCKICSKEIASNAKTCPGCGAKNKKSFYKRGWFIALAIFLVLIAIGNLDSNNTTTVSEKLTEVEQEVSYNKELEENTTIEEEVKEDIPTEYKSALKQAKTYSEMMNMSKSGIYDQLTSEYGGKFTDEAAQYAIDNVEADWKENALKSARTYQDTMAMSPSAIYDQLTSEYGGKFTKEEAQYAIDNLD